MITTKPDGNVEIGLTCWRVNYGEWTPLPQKDRAYAEEAASISKTVVGFIELMEWRKYSV